jgi:hypothetical protein
MRTNARRIAIAISVTFATMMASAIPALATPLGIRKY